MRWLALSLMFACAVSAVSAQHIDHRNKPVRPRIDVIPPMGNRLPPSYRWTYNRPTNLGGRIAYWIAPSSQEAMAWQRARQAGAYRNHLPRLERHFFYPKPWEALPVGPRTPSDRPEQESAHDAATAERLTEQGPERQPVVVDQLERETAAAHDGLGDDFGSIVLVNPTAFAPDSDPAEPDPAEPDPAKPNAATRSGNVSSEGDLHKTLRRLREENRRLREVRRQ